MFRTGFECFRLSSRSHRWLQLNYVASLRGRGVESQLFRRPLRQLLAVSFRTMDNEYACLLVKIGQGLFQFSLPPVRGEVESFDSSIHRSSSSMDHELSSVQQYSARASWNLEADHEDSILLLCGHVLHVEH